MEKGATCIHTLCCVSIFFVFLWLEVHRRLYCGNPESGISPFPACHLHSLLWKITREGSRYKFFSQKENTANLLSRKVTVFNRSFPKDTKCVIFRFLSWHRYLCCTLGQQGDCISFIKYQSLWHVSSIYTYKMFLLSLCGRDHMIVWFTPNNAITSRVGFPLVARCTRYNFIGRKRSVTCDGFPFLSTYTTDRHDITEILCKMALNIN